MSVGDNFLREDLVAAAGTVSAVCPSGLVYASVPKGLYPRYVDRSMDCSSGSQPRVSPPEGA